MWCVGPAVDLTEITGPLQALCLSLRTLTPLLQIQTFVKAPQVHLLCCAVLGQAETELVCLERVCHIHVLLLHQPAVPGLAAGEPLSKVVFVGPRRLTGHDGRRGVEDLEGQRSDCDTHRTNSPSLTPCLDADLLRCCQGLRGEETPPRRVRRLCSSSL